MVRQSKIASRLAVLVLALALVIGQIGPFRGRDLDVQALSFVRQWMSISGIDVRVRSGPSTAHSILDYLNTGHRVYVWTTERSSDLDWYLVTYVSGNYPRTGYVAAQYVKPMSANTDADFEATLTAQGFPDSYKPALRKLHELYPNWVFKATRPGVSWSTVLDNEMANWRSVIPMGYNPSYRSTNPVTYKESSNSWINWDGKTLTSSGWVMANRSTLAFYMDPRNMLDPSRVFMFESLSYDDDLHTASGIDAVLGTTFMGGGATFDYNGGKISYADAFIDAAEASGVSPYHLAARARQEVGTYSGSVTGTYSASYPFVYNYYNIGASDTGDPVLNGLQWAMLGPDRKAEYTSTDEKYLIPWQDELNASGQVTKALGRYRSIVGGAKVHRQHLHQCRPGHTLLAEIRRI